MVLSCKKGTFAKSTGANGTTQQVTIGFQAKAIIFWWTTQTAEGYTDGHKIGIGFCDSSAVDTGSRCASIVSDDNVATSATERYTESNRCIHWGTSGATTEQESYVSAIDSTSFTLTHSTNQAVAAIIHYFAIGGSDITNTKSDNFTASTTAVSQSITSLSFQPDFILFVTNKQAGANDNTASLYIGMATGPTNEGAVSILSEDARATMDTWRYQRTDRCLAFMVSGTGATSGLAEFTQFTSTGFDINWTVGSDVAGVVHFLAIKGGLPFVGNLLQPTSNGIQTYNTVAAKTPKGVMMFSANAAASSSVGSNARLSIGGTDGTNEGIIFSGDTDAVTPSTPAIRTVTTKAIGLSTEAATGSSSTTNAEADYDSFNSDNFKLNWTTTDATAREVLFIAFSEAPGGGSTDMTEVAAKTYANKDITKV